VRFILNIIVLLVWGVFPYSSYAYLITVDGSSDTTCARNIYSEAQYSNLPTGDIKINTALFNNLQKGQYLLLNAGGMSGASVWMYSPVVNCDANGARQSKTRFVMKATSNNSIATIDESLIINLGESSSNPIHTTTDLNKMVDLYKTNITGLYIFYANRINNDTIRQAIPSSYESSFTLNQRPNFRVTVWPRYVVSTDFKGVPINTSVTNSDTITFVMYDELEVGNNRFEVPNSTYNIPTPAGSIKMTATCNYSLSNNGIVDFGDHPISKVTGDRKTTAKNSLTLNMSSCYGVNKVKTSISNVSTTLENGQLAGNTLSSNAAKNVAVGINVGSTYSENASAAMYMNGSNPLQWTFGNTYTVDAISKSIPLDVYLLRSGGTPTTGDFKATATIMMDFI
jgi:type 1 fimbria pilin